MKIDVKNGNVTGAYRILMKALLKDGLFKELKHREAYETPRAKKLRKHKLAVSRIKKEARKRDEIFAIVESRIVYRKKHTEEKTS